MTTAFRPLRGVKSRSKRLVIKARAGAASIGRYPIDRLKFSRSLLTYRAMAPDDRRPKFRYLQPMLHDDTTVTPIEPVYFYQDAWAFERIVRAAPSHHVDVGSHHKFVALLSKVVPVSMVDLRPLSLAMDSIDFQAGSILALPFPDASQESVSSICVIEHVGLGRYGDDLDPMGTEKALAELKRVVRPGGNLYLSVPLDDTTRVYFNAHRAYAEADLLQMFKPFEVEDRKYIFGTQFEDHPGRGFGTGCYHLRRPS